MCEVVLCTIDPLSSVHLVLCLFISLGLLCCGVSGRSMPGVASPVSSHSYATSHVYIPVPMDPTPSPRPLDTCTFSAHITSQFILIKIRAECQQCYCGEIRQTFPTFIARKPDNSIRIVEYHRKELLLLLSP
jgi:hypothetical protein